MTTPKAFENPPRLIVFKLDRSDQDDQIATRRIAESACRFSFGSAGDGGSDEYVGYAPQSDQRAATQRL